MERVATRSESFDKFKHQPGYSYQYTNIYYDRLQQLKDTITPPKAWTEAAKRQERILDLNAGELSWIVGTIVRELAHKPNIFEDLKKIYHGNYPQHDPKYCSPEDNIYLEDEHGRILLFGDLKTRELLVTGTVVGLLGIQNKVGEFEAKEICYPAAAPQPAIDDSKTENGKVALISGICIDENDLESALKLQSLLEFVSERKDISRLIICGNSLVAPQKELIGSRVMRPQLSGNSLSILDELLSSLASILPVHLMPGESDPATVAFPQMPIHPALFRHSRALLEGMALSLETNPQKFEIEGRTILGSSGQPVGDLSKYTDETVASNPGLELDLLHKTLIWRHISPTAPDTLWSYPYRDEDPMVMVETPHVFFTGNASHFKSENRDNVRLICVPSFKATGEVVLLDLASLDVELIEFS